MSGQTVFRALTVPMSQGTQIRVQVLRGEPQFWDTVGRLQFSRAEARDFLAMLRLGAAEAAIRYQETAR
jgi:hypothetical protein